MFTRILYEFPNTIIGTIDVGNVVDALKKGITADQVSLHYEQQNVDLLLSEETWEI